MLRDARMDNAYAGTYYYHQRITRKLEILKSIIQHHECMTGASLNNIEHHIDSAVRFISFGDDQAEEEVPDESI